MSNSYKHIINEVICFSNKHRQIKRFVTDFEDWIENKLEASEAFPTMYAAPVDATYLENVNQFSIRFGVVVKQIQSRDNVNYEVNNTSLILSELATYFREEEGLEIDLINEPNAIPLNNVRLSGYVGFEADFELHVDATHICNIPFDPVIDCSTPSSDCLDSTVSNSSDTYIESVSSGGSLELPDITHTDSDGSPVVLPAQTPFVATLCSGGAKRSSELYKTGQTTSFQLGDDASENVGNGVGFYTLSENNPFGNAARFTDFSGNDFNGGGILTDLVIDWSTADYVNDKVLVYNKKTLTSATWSNQIIAAQTAPAGEPSSGWFLLNPKQALNIVDYEIADTPTFFNPYGAGDAWLSTTNPNNTPNAMQIINEFTMTQAAKTNTRSGRQARIYTFTEIGL